MECYTPPSLAICPHCKPIIQFVVCTAVFCASLCTCLLQSTLLLEHVNCRQLILLMTAHEWHSALIIVLPQPGAFLSLQSTRYKAWLVHSLMRITMLVLYMSQHIMCTSCDVCKTYTVHCSHILVKWELGSLIVKDRIQMLKVYYIFYSCTFSDSLFRQHDSKYFHQIYLLIKSIP